MKKYSLRPDQEKGNFSTPFADMVFCMLFIFFLLAIAMVFNRPEVSAFQEKTDQILRDLDEKNKDFDHGQRSTRR